MEYISGRGGLIYDKAPSRMKPAGNGPGICPIFGLLHIDDGRFLFEMVIEQGRIIGAVIGDALLFSR